MRAGRDGQSRRGRRWQWFRLAGGGLAASLLAVTASGSALATSASAGGARAHRAVLTSNVTPADVVPSDWAAYLNGAQHTSYSRTQTAITPANARSLVRKWRFTVGAPYVASPTVVGGSVYVGSSRGWFYKLSATTGKVLARIYLGYQPRLTCAPNGVSATATVATDPANHALTVYVTGANGYLYALRSYNLSVEWRALVALPSSRVNNYYNWSSPTVANGRIYLGLSSSCDRPLIRGGVVAFSQVSGRKLAQFFTVPAGPRNAGGSVWSSIGVGPGGEVFATTGNGPAARPQLDRSESILKLGPVTLKLLGSFKVPAGQVGVDSDFGSSPVFFGNDVGACNKNGAFYAVNRNTMKLAWSDQVAAATEDGSAACLAAPPFNGSDLFLAGGATTVGGTAYKGSVEEVTASTGALVWQTGLPGAVIGSPALDGAGLLTAGAYAGPPTGGIYFLNAATGALVYKLPGGLTFAQTVFARNWLFGANKEGVTAWAVPSG